MNNLLNCAGIRFRCRIFGKYVEGKIQVENRRAYLCQDEVNGIGADDKLGFKYSWGVGRGGDDILSANNVTDFQLLPITAEEIEAYKDWRVGDEVSDGDIPWTVIFRSGEVVICKDRDGDAVGPHTCDELHAMGFRLVAEPAPEEEEEEEDASFDDVAVTLHVTVERPRFKKK